MTNIYLFTFEKLGTDQGIRRYINELSKALTATSNYKVTIVTFYSDKSSKEVFIENKIRRINIVMPNKEEQRKLVYYDLDLYNIACSRILKKYVDPLANNIFHLNYNQHDLLVDHLRNISPKAKIVFTIHFMRWLTAIDYDFDRFQKLLFLKQQNELTPKEFLSINDFTSLKSLCEVIDKVICLSEYTYKLLVTMYNVPDTKISLLKNGLEGNSITSKRITSSLENKWKNIENKPKIIIYSGRIEENKGIHLLFEAFKLVIREFNDVILIVAGKGDYDKFFNLANQSLGKIYFTGELNSDELNSLYEIADIGIHPSLNEQCSFSVLEMMKYGLPIIGYDLSGMSCLINHNLNGTKISLKKNIKISEQRDEMIKDLVNTIIQYLENPIKITKEGNNSRLCFERYFNQKAFSKRMEDFYNNILYN